MTDYWLGLTLGLIAGVVIGDVYLISEIVRSIRSAVQRRRDRAERVLPDAWALHVAGLNRPAVYRRKAR